MLVLITTLYEVIEFDVQSFMDMKNVTLVKFYSESCRSCARFAPVYEALEKEVNTIRIG